MEVTNRTAGGRGQLPERPVLRHSPSRAARLMLAFGAAIWACGFPIAATHGEEFVILAQSPGPLLDDREFGSWLEDFPDPVPAREGTNVAARVGVGSSVAAEDGLSGSQRGGASTDGGWYGNQREMDTWPEDLSGSQGAGYGEVFQCPECGGVMTATCPTCSSEVGLEPGFMARGLDGIHSLGTCGPIAGCREFLEPMTQESWLYRPLSAGWFMGFMQGNELIDDWVGQEQGFFGGYRLGWDFDPYWGCEMRFGFASVALYDSDRAKAAQAAADLADGLTVDDPYYYRFDTRRDSGIRVWDVDMLWYPFGDSYLRPYFLLGLGTARVDFMDRLSNRRIKSVLAMPIALGFKYRLRDWVALRVQATDNFIAGAGSGFKNLHNFSLTAGVEVRFGGVRTAYWPYYPGRHYW